MTEQRLLQPGDSFSLTVTAAPLPPPPPFGSIQSHIDKGGVVIVEPGTYRELVHGTRPVIVIATGATIDATGLAVPQQAGAVSLPAGSVWYGGRVTGSSAAGLDTSNASDVLWVGVEVDHNAEEGYHVNAAKRVDFLRCHFHHNNPDGTWTKVDEQGGGKASGSDAIRFLDCESDHNGGPGFWYDGSCTNGEVRGCRIHHNTGQGVADETGDGTVVADNAIWENGWAFLVEGWGAGILCSSSGHGRYVNNVVAWNGDGIVVRWQNRPDAHAAVANYVGDNVIAVAVQKTPDPDIRPLAFISDSPAMYALDAGNRAERNRIYRGDTSAPTSYYRYAWAGGRTSMDAMNAVCGSGSPVTGAAANREITLAELTPLLVAAGVPTTPEAH